MEENTTAQVESTETTTSSAPESTATETTAPVASAVVAAPEKAVAFTPNYKVKAYDTEYEIPERFRSLIKDAETEKEVRDIFERAYGLDGMKQKHQKLQGRYGEYEKVIKEEYTPLRDHFTQLNKYIANKDFDTLFATAGIPELELQKWMLSKLQAAQLPPDQRAIYDKEASQRQRLYELEMQNQQYQAQLEAQKQMQLEADTQARSMQLDTALSQGAVKPIVDAYETRTGKSFRDVVIKLAQAEFKATGKDMSVEEAVKEALDIVGGVSPAQPTGQVGSRPPVIPAVAGKSTSPTAKKINSIADLEAMARTLSQG